ncbi:unnamed protein product [Colias eurytheme]|nr:unnamed protein product [Colias eurytheme]
MPSSHTSEPVGKITKNLIRRCLWRSFLHLLAIFGPYYISFHKMHSFYNGLISDDAIEDHIDGLDTVDFEIQFDDNVE